MRLLRTFPPLEALPVIGIAVTLVRDLPADLYEELVKHPYEIRWPICPEGVCASLFDEKHCHESLRELSVDIHASDQGKPYTFITCRTSHAAHTSLISRAKRTARSSRLLDALRGSPEPDRLNLSRPLSLVHSSTDMDSVAWSLPHVIRLLHLNCLYITGTYRQR